MLFSEHARGFAPDVDVPRCHVNVREEDVDMR